MNFDSAEQQVHDLMYRLLRNGWFIDNYSSTENGKSTTITIEYVT